MGRWGGTKRLLAKSRLFGTRSSSFGGPLGSVTQVTSLVLTRWFHTDWLRLDSWESLKLQLGIESRFGDVGWAHMTPFWAYCLFFNKGILNIIFTNKPKTVSLKIDSELINFFPNNVHSSFLLHPSICGLIPQSMWSGYWWWFYFHWIFLQTHEVISLGPFHYF